MPAREILQLGNPLLWQKSESIQDLISSETKALVDDLSDTLKAFRDSRGFGRGIAAPQIGILKRAVFIRMESPGFEGPLVNPEIVWKSGKRVEVWDNCFSFPDLVVKVERAARVKVEYFDQSGRQRIVEASDDLSELLQHEIDHLDGILAVQRAVSPKSFITYREWLRQGRPRH